jgi:hypothetical protein
MFRMPSLILILSIFAMPAFAGNSTKSSDNDHEAKIILQFHTMFGVNDPFLSHETPLPNDPTLRGILGDYQSWKIKKSVNGMLLSDGDLFVNIKGLIFGNGTDNDEENFRALVSCQLTPDVPGGASATFATFKTGPFSVSHPIGKGNANINAHIPNFPNSCIAPVVMILNGDETEGDVWFAVTGN